MIASTELSILAKRILDILNDANFEDTFIQKVTTLVENDNSEIKKSLNRDSSSNYTEQLEAKDDERDDCFMGFRDYVKASMSRRKYGVKEAAEKLIKLIKKHGWTLYDSGYSEQSAKMELLIQDLKTEEAVNAILKIGGGMWYEDLANSHNEFEELYNKKLEEKTGEEIQLIRKAKRNLGRHLSILVDSLNILEEVTPNITNAISEPIDEAIKDVMATARARKTRKENNTEETEEAN